MRSSGEGPTVLVLCGISSGPSLDKPSTFAAYCIASETQKGGIGLKLGAVIALLAIVAGATEVVSSRVVASPILNSSLLSIACTTAANCTAVGDWATLATPYTVIEHWNGRAWALVPEPPEGTKAVARNLGGVACASESNCTAVGWASPTYGKS